jgi:hypothetical protein
MEIMVAVIIFAIVVVGILSFLHWGRGHIVRMGMRRNALALAEQKVEALRAADISVEDLQAGGHGPEIVQVTEQITGSRTWSVAWRDDPANGVSSSDQDYKEVIVGVAWSWELNKQDSVSLSGRFYP